MLCYAKPQEISMIISTIQAKEAIEEIMKRTNWTFSKVGRECGIHRFAIEKVITGQTKNMNDANLAKIDKLYRFVDKHTEPAEG